MKQEATISELFRSKSQTRAQCAFNMRNFLLIHVRRRSRKRINCECKKKTGRRVCGGENEMRRTHTFTQVLTTKERE